MHISISNEALVKGRTSRIENMTNEDFVADLMAFSDHGPLMQLLIIDLLAKGAKRVAEAPVVDDHGMIDMHAWKSCAAELQTRLNEKYGAL